jgi:hypothetical protein
MILQDLFHMEPNSTKVEVYGLKLSIFTRFRFTSSIILIKSINASI